MPLTTMAPVVAPTVAEEFSPDRDASLLRVERLGEAGHLSRTSIARELLPRVEAETRPDAVYTVFSLALWHARTCPHLLGFAWPHLLYPESPFVRSVRSLRRGMVGLRIRGKELLEVRELRQFRHIVVETQTVARRLREVCGVTHAEMHVVRNSYSPAFKARVAAAGARPPEDRKVILVPSDYRPHKNQEIVPAVAQALAKRSDVPFEMVLTIPFGKEWEGIEADARKRGVAERVRNLGSVPHARFAEAYLGAHMVYLPTLLECSTAVYPEAFMAGRPVVTSDLDFSRELCEEAALYCDPYSAEEAAERIARVIEDDSLAARMVQSGEQVLARNYPTPEEKWASLVEVLETVAGSEVGR